MHSGRRFPTTCRLRKRWRSACGWFRFGVPWVASCWRNLDPARAGALADTDTPVVNHDIAEFALPIAMRALWIFVLLGWGLDAFRKVRRKDWNVTLFQVFLFIGAAGLNLSLATFGPGDLHWNQAPFFLSPHGYDPMYGSSPGGLLRLLFPLIPRTFDASIVIQILLGALAAVLAVSLGSALGLGRVQAAFTGIILAAQPLLVRFSGEGDRQAYVLVLVIMTLLHLARHRRDGSWTELVRYVVAATLCLHARPEGILILIPAVAFTLSAGEPGGAIRTLATMRRLVGEGLAHLVVVALLVPYALVSLSQFSGYWTSSLGSNSRSLADVVWLNPEFTASACIALVLTGFAAALFNRHRMALWASMSMCAVTWFGLSYPTAGLKIASARYQTLALPLLILVAAYGLHFLMRLGFRLTRRTAVREVLQVATPIAILCWIALATQAPMRMVTSPRTIDYEFRFLMSALPLLPADAEIFYTYPSDRYNLDLGLRAPPPLSILAGRTRQQWIQFRPDETLQPSSHPRFYFQQASCYATHANLDEVGRAAVAVEWGDRCRQAMARFGDSPFLEETIPASRFASDLYLVDPLRVGFFRMQKDL